MDRKKVLRWSLASVFVIVFNLIFYLFSGANHPTSVWIAYGFVHFAYLMLIFTPKLTRKSSSSAVFGFSIYTISSFYFAIELVIAFAVFILKPESIQASLIVQLILAGIYAIVLLSNLLANEHTADQIEKHEQEVLYLKNASARVNQLIGKAGDKKIEKVIEHVYDLLHSSPTRSMQSVHSIEREIVDDIGVLENAVYKKNSNDIIDIAEKIEHKINERNIILRSRQ